MNKKIAITLGDYNGIGPEIVIKAINKLDLNTDNFCIIGNQIILDYYKEKFDLSLNKNIEIIDIPMLSENIHIKNETKDAGIFSYKCLKKACELAEQKKINGLVTAPVSKNAMHLGGYNFSGQTEVLEKLLAHNAQKAEMLFIADDFRVLLLTRHISLNKIKITKNFLIEKITRLNAIFKTDFGISKPSFALCSLNPHAGENGVIGKEEIDEFLPAIEILKGNGINITQPLPADTLFVKAAKSFYSKTSQPFDCYIACYHDQGLIPIKMLAMDNCVNTTIGLDILRTSPAHGTAYDIAGDLKADCSSMVAAIKVFLNNYHKR